MGVVSAIAIPVVKEKYQGPNHLLHWRQISIKTWTEFLHLAGALLEHFLEMIGLLQNWYINPNEKSNKY